jgi:rod shape-determining protein MreC
MPDISLSRHRPLALLAGLVLAQVLLLAFQIKRDHDVRLVRYWAAEIVMPFERSGTWTFAKSGGIWSGYFALRGTYAENARLRSELAILQIRNRELESQAGEAQRLSALLNFREVHPEAPMLAAQVIGASADTSSHTVSINRGERDRVRRNMAVITPNGIAGKIVEVFPTTAQVLLISDKDSGVGSLLADTRTHGVVKGSGDPDPRLDYVVNDEKVHMGELVLTSGEDRIFPKGLLVGSVIGAAPGNPFQIIHVRAAARLDRLDDVLVLLSLQDLNPKTADESSDASPVPPDAPGVVPPQAAPPKSTSEVDRKALKPSDAARSAQTPAQNPAPAAPPR